MLTLRAFVVVITGAGLVAGLSLTHARACDDDRYPCPVRSQTLAQETADAPTNIDNPPVRPMPSPKPQRKVNQPARPNQKAQANGEGEGPRAVVRAKRRADSIWQKAAEPAPAVVPPSRTDQALLVSTAATPRSVLPNTEDASASAPGATGVAVTKAAKANAVQLVNPNEINDLDRAAETVSAGWSWSTYLLLSLGAALAATAVYARRAAGAPVDS